MHVVFALIKRIAISEDDSILSMVDSNLHRERISYSEKAFAYKLKNDVLKRKSEIGRAHV